jgi:hypothetical protein
MLCEACYQRAATVHLATTVQAEGLEHESGTQREQHFCEQCANDYFARTPGMRSLRGLICLSDSFRARLYDLLEVAHPEVFDDCEDPLVMMRAAEAMRTFLRLQLEKEKIEVNDEVFDMLCGDFMGSDHFYSRRDEYRRKRGNAGSEGR